MSTSCPGVLGTVVECSSDAGVDRDVAEKAIEHGHRCVNASGGSPRPDRGNERSSAASARSRRARRQAARTASESHASSRRRRPRRPGRRPGMRPAGEEMRREEALTAWSSGDGARRGGPDRRRARSNASLDACSRASRPPGRHAQASAVAAAIAPSGFARRGSRRSFNVATPRVPTRRSRRDREHARAAGAAAGRRSRRGLRPRRSSDSDGRRLDDRDLPIVEQQAGGGRAEVRQGDEQCRADRGVSPGESCGTRSAARPGPPVRWTAQRRPVSVRRNTQAWPSSVRGRRIGRPGRRLPRRRVQRVQAGPSLPAVRTARPAAARRGSASRRCSRRPSGRTGSGRGC